MVHDVVTWARHWAFAGYEPWLDRLARAPSWEAEQLSTILETRVTFRAQTHGLRAGLDASDVDDSYADFCCRGVVPTRKDNLHDLLNALTWARFPRAKQALSERQVRLARARPPLKRNQRQRSREQDAAAMVDEGGMLLGPTTRAIFGHAALEDATHERQLRPFLLHLASDDLDDELARLLASDAPIPRVRERIVVLASL